MYFSFCSPMPTEEILLVRIGESAVDQVVQEVSLKYDNPSTVPIHLLSLRSIAIVLMKLSGIPEVAVVKLVQVVPSNRCTPPSVVPTQIALFASTARART